MKQKEKTSTKNQDKTVGVVPEIVSRVQQELVQAADELTLLNDTCRLIAEVGGYALVWIGLAEQDNEKTVLPVAYWGDDRGYLDEAKLSWSSGTEGQHPPGFAIRQRKPCLMRNLRAESRFTEWRNDAVRRGYRSVVSLPMVTGAETFGALTIHAADPDAFTDDTVDLLTKLAGDVARSVVAIRTRMIEEKGFVASETSEALYRSIFENTGTGTIIIDPDLVIVSANTKFVHLTGFSKYEIQGKMKWSEFVAAGDRERMMNYHYRRRIEPENVPTEYECKVVDRYGNIKDIFMKVGMIPGSRMSIASFMDITYRKKAEDRLRQRESQLSAIIENFEGLIYIYNRDYRIEFMNKALIERTGRDAIGEPCYKVLHNQDKPCDWCRNDRVFEGETVKWEVKSPKDNRWFYAVSSPIFSADGSISRVQTMVLDITDRKLAEEALIEREEYLRKENIRLRNTIRDRYRFGSIIGKSHVMQEVYELILKATATDAGVIIYGESGTGKELVARAIHDLSDRQNREFVAVNCGAIAETIIESEFFGYVKGAFTGANTDKEGFLDLADGGTLFLDEIGEISLNLQVKLLRVLESGEYTPVGGTRPRKTDVRIVAATHRDLVEHVKKGLMREDFFYRIHIIPIHLPPLRERKEDLPLLIDHFLHLHAGDREIPVLKGKVLEAFNAYHWPGNVRELQNILQRYLTIGKLDFMGGPGPQVPAAAAGEATDTVNENLDLRAAMDACEKQMITRALEKSRWHREKTAELLGIHRKTLFTKMKDHGLI